MEKSKYPLRLYDETQMSQALSAMADEYTPDQTALPVGSVVWWVSGRVGAVPAHWVIANGTDNAVSEGGSGYNLIGYFIMATHTDGDVGDTAAKSTTGDTSPHDHVVPTSVADITVDHLIRPTSVSYNQDEYNAGRPIVTHGSPHMHDVMVSSEASHSHEIPDPQSVALIPIERMP